MPAVLPATALRAVHAPAARAMGTIQSARASFNTVARSSASGPYACAAPTTEEVSWMEIAAQTPNWPWLRCSACPMGGKMNSATAFRMNTVASETVIDSARAPIAGPTAAIALPPQMLVPAVIKNEVCSSTFSARPNSTPKVNVSAIPATV